VYSDSSAMVRGRNCSVIGRSAGRQFVLKENNQSGATNRSRWLVTVCSWELPLSVVFVAQRRRDNTQLPLCFFPGECMVARLVR
jgi:hypothetical protein